MDYDARSTRTIVNLNNMTEKGKLYRSNTNRTIAGVAGGIAEHFNIDPVIVRAVFVLTAIFGGGGLIIYAILWIIIPIKQVNTSKTEEINNNDTDFNNTSTMENDFENKKEKRNYHGNLTGGIILITLGILFLLDRFVPNVNFGDLWPIILIVIGFTLLLKGFSKKNNQF